jgi:hypothetical protein
MPVVIGVDLGIINPIAAALVTATPRRGPAAGRLRITQRGWADGQHWRTWRAARARWRAPIAALDAGLAATTARTSDVGELVAYGRALCALLAPAARAVACHMRLRRAAFSAFIDRRKLTDRFFAAVAGGTLAAGTRGAPPALIAVGNAFGAPNGYMRLAALRAAEHDPRMGAAAVALTSEKCTSCAHGRCGAENQAVFAMTHSRAAIAAHEERSRAAEARGAAPPPPLPAARRLHDLQRCPDCGCRHRDFGAAGDIGVIGLAGLLGLPPPFTNARETTRAERVAAGLVSQQRAWVLGAPGGAPPNAAVDAAIQSSHA